MGYRTRQGLKRSGRDFVLALIAFCLLVAAITMEHQIVSPLGMVFDGVSATALSSEFSVPAAVSAEFGAKTVTLMVAAVLFSAIIAFKLAFIRHLRRVHASSRRGAWRES